MSASIEEKDRRIFPRWRSFTATTQLGELSFATDYLGRDVNELDISLAKGVASWEGNPTLWRGLDLLSSAIVAGRLQEFPALIARVKEDPLTPRVARDALHRATNIEPVQLELENVEQIPDIAARKEIRERRRNLRDYPKDAIEWMELARAYTIAGVNDKAARAVMAALQLAPTNRFVLRSAARFLIHIGKQDLAYNLLSNSPMIKQDPWLLASQLAIGSSIGEKPRFIRAARATVGADLAPGNLTELASALGTLETESGNFKGARKLIRQALINPNENSVAQIKWLNRTHLGDNVDLSNVKPPLLHEATAWSAFYNGSFTIARDEALSWLRDQPFASAPAILSSYILADVLEEYERGRDIARAALRANPKDTSLLNNLAVCLAENGELVEAEQVLKQIYELDERAEDDAILSATSGLLAFRKGEIAEGRQLYLQAIESATRSGAKSTAARAAIHLAVEEFLAHTPLTEEAMNRLKAYRGEEQVLEIAGLLGRLQRIIKED